VDKLSNDKIGLIVFAGNAYTQLPITTDYVSAKMFLSSITPGMVPTQGTAIGSAIDLAVKSYSPDNEKNKALIIITDGENHEDNAVEAAAHAAEKGIIVHTIGMGLPDGSPIPIPGRFGKNDYKTDKDGNVVISKLDEKMLQQIASSGNGIYIRANNSVSALNTLFDEISKMAKQKIEAKVFSDYEHRFQYFIAIGLFFLLLEFVLLERQNRWLKKINLFKNNT
jgi:Ca-activated chloride channel homolog